MQQRLPSLLDPPIMFAHRGAKAHAPENTIAGLPARARDGRHRARERRVAHPRRRARARSTTASSGAACASAGSPTCAATSFRTTSPSLDDLVDACGTDYPPLARPQGAAVGPAGDRRPRRPVAGAAGAHMAVSSRSGDAGRAASRQPDASSWSTRPASHARRRRRAPRRPLAEAGIDGINLRRDDWTGGLVALFHRFDRTAFAWDLQFEHELRAALRMGMRRRLQRLRRPHGRGLHAESS